MQISCRSVALLFQTYLTDNRRTTLHARTFAKLTDLQPTSERTTQNMFCALAWGRAKHPNKNEVHRSTRTPNDRTRHPSRASSSDRVRASDRASRNLSQASSAHHFPTRASLPDYIKSELLPSPFKTGWAGWVKKIFRRSAGDSLRAKMATAIAEIRRSEWHADLMQKCGTPIPDLPHR